MACRGRAEHAGAVPGGRWNTYHSAVSAQPYALTLPPAQGLSAGGVAAISIEPDPYPGASLLLCLAFAAHPVAAAKVQRRLT